MTQIYLLQSVFAFVVFVCEIPSGYISDLFGRKKTLIMSSFLAGIGFALFPLSSGFTTLVVAEIILGVGLSLQSGTDTSLLYDTLEAIDSPKAEIKLLGKSQFYLSFGETISAILAAIMYSYISSLQFMAYSSALISWIPLFIAFGFIEPPRKKLNTSSHIGNLKYIYNNMFKKSLLLNLILLNMVVYSTGTLVAVWAFQKQWQSLNIPMIYFGYIWAITNLVVAISSKYAHKVEKIVGSSTVLVLMGLFLIVGYLGMGFVTVYIGIVFCLCFNVARSFNGVILKDALNKRVSSEFRATANSISQMGTRTLFMVLGPLVGFSIDRYGVFAVMKVAGYLYIVIFFIVLLPLLAQKKNFIPIK